MGFLLLGVDSLIACLAIGAVVGSKWRLPLAALFGICDGAGFLLGTALHWSMPGTTATIVATGVFVALGVYWIVLAFGSKQVGETRWVWVLPFVLSIDNITFGVIDHSWTHNTWGQAVEQTLGSAILAMIGLLISGELAKRVPAIQRSRVLATGLTGGAMIIAAGVELLVG